LLVATDVIGPGSGPLTAERCAAMNSVGMTCPATNRAHR
jgi:hypothetical protein